MIRASNDPATARIDLHLHTTASDGRCTPAELVRRASAAGLTVMAVTDHDTVSAVRETQAHAAGLGIEVVPGIEITAVQQGHDVHVLGYFIDIDDGPLAAFLARQRADRVERARAIARRLAEMGVHVDIEPIVARSPAAGGRSVGRPQIARALIDAGYATDLGEVFDRWIGRGRSAFVPRTGEPPAAVVAAIHRAGGLASLAHPGRTEIDAAIPVLCAAGLDALEVYHSDHDTALVDRYGRMAEDLGVLRTGGSDFHGDRGRVAAPGAATLPAAAWEDFHAARHRHAGR